MHLTHSIFNDNSWLIFSRNLTFTMHNIFYRYKTYICFFKCSHENSYVFYIKCGQLCLHIQCRLKVCKPLAESVN